MIHKTMRSILSVLLAALLLVTSVPLTPAFAGDGGGVSLPSANSERGGLEGSGKEGDPYQIATADDLLKFAKLVNDGETTAWAELTANIDLSSVCSKEKGPWTPIGNEDHLYTGTFDGQNFKISGLYIKNTSSDTDDQGLFGSVGSSGKIENLTVSGSVNSSGDYVGGIVGQNNGNVINCAFSGSVSGNSYVGGVVGVVGVVGDSSGSVKNCYNTGAVSSLDSGSGNSVGGVVGYNDIGGSVTNCYNTGSVNGSIEAGGVVGSNSLSATVTNCYNTGEVSGMYVGGVVGYNDGPVKNCYNTGSVSGKISVGGVVGYNSGPVKNCYNTGSVSGPDSVSGSYVGGVVGYNGVTGTVTDCYFLQTADVNKDLQGIGNDSGSGSTENVKSLTAEAFKNQNSFTSWDFAITWKIEPIFGRPTLQANAEIGGTANNPYRIFTATQLAAFRDLVNDENDQTADPDAHAKLMNNIDLKDVCGESLHGGTSWNPIGSFSNSYKGTFDGNGKTISGLYIGTTANNQGLFGYVGTGGTVKDLTVSGTVTGTGDYVGGVVGYNNGTVENCYNTGSVSGLDSVGGVAGWNDGSVENCYNTGKVSGGAGVGGVVGYNSSTVENCYNIGEVSGSPVGGVVGYNISSVTNCYFLQRTAESGIGQNVGSGDDTATEKDDTAFHSGEVAWRLQDGQAEDQITPVWGQNIGEDKSPVLTSDQEKTVYRVPVDLNYTGAQADQVIYTNSTLNAKEPTREGYTFDGWYDNQECTGERVTAITEDTTILYAKWTAVEEPDPEPEEPPYTGKYSYEIATDIGDNGAISVDRYATEGEKVTITVTPDDAYLLDDLSVTAGGKEVALTANSDGTYTFTMPSADVRITATFAEDPDWSEPEEPTTDVSDLFSDIAPDAWYKDAVQYAYDNGLMTGVSATEFAPEQTTTRAMIVSILARLENVTTAEAAGFADVDGNEWYATAVNWAANVGVVNGYEDNTFRPNTAITREQLAAILMNYAAYKGEDVSNRASLATYTDQPSTWAEEAMQWAVAEGLISGVTNDQLQPQGNATRAQVAAILQRFLAQ